MPTDKDRLVIYDALAGRGDLDDAVAALHRLPAGFEGRGEFAARLIEARVGGNLIGDVSRMGGALREQLAGLLAVAEADPPAFPDWPRRRTVARILVAMIAATDGSVADPSAALADLERIAPDAADDPTVAGLLRTARMALEMRRAFDQGDPSVLNRMREYARELGTLGPQSAELAAIGDLMADVGTLAMAPGHGGELEARLRDLRERAERFPPGHPVRTSFEEMAAQAGPLVGMSGVLNTGVPMPPENLAADTAAAEELAARVDAPADVRAMRHAAAGALALGADMEMDVGRVTEAVDHFRAAVDLAPPAGGDQVSHLSGLALALVRRNELTADLADLAAAAEALARARTLAGGPHHRAWANINEMYTSVQRRLGDPEARSFALEQMRGTAWRVLLQEDAGAVREAADAAIEVARQCLVEGAVADAIRALDGGRGLLLFAATEFRDVVPRLRAAGRTDLADRWSRAVADKSAAAMPAGLRSEVISALAANAGLLDPPDVGEIQDALRTLDADALVYLVPSRNGAPGWAVTVPASGAAGGLALPNLETDSVPDVERCLRALMTRDASLPGSRPGADDLGVVCDWAWNVAMGPLFRQFLTRLPARDAREPGRPRRLVLVPMGELALVPWQAARDGDGRYALESAAFSQAASARMLCRSADAAPIPARPVGLVVGDPDTRHPDTRHPDTRRPDIQRSHPALPAARLEAFAVHQTFCRGARYLGRRPDHSPSPSGAGTVKEFLGWLAAPEPGAVLHLACHGDVRTAAADPTAFLLLAEGGEATAQEILRTLTGMPECGIALAVLAACRTAQSIHGYDEAYSLGTAFLAGGVRSVLSTLWSVPDNATSALMFMVHHHLWADGLPAWEALWRAQLWMLDPDRRIPETMPAPLRRSFEGERAAGIGGWAAFVHWGQ